MNSDDEINLWWCQGAVKPCTPAEAIGIWSVTFFYSTVVIVTLVHSIIVGIRRNSDVDVRQTQHVVDGGGTVTSPLTRSPYPPTSGPVARERPGDDDMMTMCLLLVYFFALAAGCLVWALGGSGYVHPFRSRRVQLFGSAMMMVCTALFVAVHIDLGDSWSPFPEKLENHKLVTKGSFQWARHPMYAVVLWATIGTLLATLNLLITWIVLGFVGVLLRRIPVEERIMVELFGDEYRDYQRQVPALGLPWCCTWMPGYVRFPP